MNDISIKQSKATRILYVGLTERHTERTYIIIIIIIIT